MYVPSTANTALTGAPGSVLPWDTLVQGEPQPPSTSPEVVRTSPVASAMNTVKVPPGANSAVT